MSSIIRGADNFDSAIKNSVDTIVDLLSADTNKVKVINVLNYHSDTEGGGGIFYYDSNRSKSEHNGGTIIDPTKLYPVSWGDQMQLTDWFTATNTSDGVWVRQYDGAVNVKWFGAKGDGVTNDTLSLQRCFNSLSSGSTFYLGKGVFIGWLYWRKNNITCIGAGSTVTTIKLPDNAQHTQPDETGTINITGVPSVIDFGEISKGNNANSYYGATISGITLDGNKDNTAAPTLDLFGWGMSFTKFSGVSYNDIKIANTHCGGIGQFINSNEHKGSAIVYNSGFALGHPGFDMNSSKNSEVNITSIDCNYGARILDNCWNNKCSFVIKNPNITGIVYTNQSVNVSYDNEITAVIENGCSSSGFSFGDNCYGSKINVTTSGLIGFSAEQPASSTSFGNKIEITSYNGKSSSCYIGGNSNDWDIVSCLDGRSGETGAVYSVVVAGDNNTIGVNLQDTATWQVRGINLTATSSGNKIKYYKYINTADPYNDNGYNNEWLGNDIVAWQIPTLLAGWGNTYGSPYPEVSYLKDGSGSVFVRGAISGGTLGTSAFLLPTGFRPSKRLLVATDAGVVEIREDGNVIPTTGNGVFQLVLTFTTK